MSSEAANYPRPIDALPQNTGAGVDGGHEENVVRLSTTVWLTIASVIVVAIVQFVLWMGLKAADTTRKADRPTALFPGREAIKPDQFPEPRLEVRYDDEIEKVRVEQSALVENYAWVDKSSGIARIPVDRALEILAKTGLPKVAAPAPTAGAPPNTFVPIAGKRDMAPLSTGESPAKAGAPPSVLPPGGDTKKADPTPPTPSTPSEAPRAKAKEARP